MKNALIRGLNNLHNLAPRVLDNHRVPFLRYASVVCDILYLHLKGDQLFLSRTNSQGKSLLACSTIEANINQDLSQLLAATSKLRNNIKSWLNAPDSYAPVHLQRSLDAIAALILAGMTNQRLVLDKDNLIQYCPTEAEIREMIHENLLWLTSEITISILLPFVLSHHDPSTSAYWPAVSPQGRQLVPGFVDQDSACWYFAPFDPITGQPADHLLSVL
ncbi:hypothetical protein H0H93_016163 [Arthromyces matolae]|nr:hypothetical protein H0H93_016163 [Arthromyces matolae]